MDIKRIVTVARELFIDAIGIVGFGAIFYGLRSIYEPIAWIVCGSLLVVYSVVVTLRR